jgi:hypothetical protein
MIKQGKAMCGTTSKVDASKDKAKKKEKKKKTQYTKTYKIDRT